MDNDTGLLITGILVGAIVAFIVTSIVASFTHVDIAHDRAVEYGIGGYDQQTGEFEYYEERKCQTANTQQ